MENQKIGFAVREVWGDPLSPFLFTLVVDVLCLISIAIASGSTKGVTVGSKVAVVSLSFAIC